MLCAVLLGIIAILTAAYFLSSQRERSLAESERQLATTAQILSRQLGYMFDAIESVQEELIGEPGYFWDGSADRFDGYFAGQDVHLKLRDKNLGMPYVGSLGFFGPTGKLVNFSRQWPVPQIDISDRDFFQALSAPDGPARYFGRPVHNRASGTLVMHLARRVTSIDGKFLGVISAAIDLEYLTAYFKTISKAPDSALGLFRADGTLLLVEPLIPEQLGKPFKNALALQLVAETGSGVGRAEGVLAPRPRIVAAHQLNNFPVIVASTSSMEGALTEWTRIAAFVVTGTAFILFGIVVATVVVVRSFRRHQELIRMRTMEAESQKVRAQNMRFDAALNNMSQGLTMFDESWHDHDGGRGGDRRSVRESSERRLHRDAGLPVQCRAARFGNRGSVRAAGRGAFERRLDAGEQHPVDRLPRIRLAVRRGPCVSRMRADVAEW